MSDRFGAVGRLLSVLAISLAGGLIAQAAHMPAGLLTGGAWILSQHAAMPFGQIWLGLAPGALESPGMSLQLLPSALRRYAFGRSKLKSFHWNDFPAAPDASHPLTPPSLRPLTR